MKGASPAVQPFPGGFRYDPHLFAREGLLMPPALDLAMQLVMAVGRTASLGHLPVPARFRAVGALRAWQNVFDTLPGLREAQAALRDAEVWPGDAANTLVSALTSHVRVRQGPRAEYMSDRAQTYVHGAALMLAFWWRNGVLYEPSVPLSTLLSGTDIAQDIPVEMLTPSVPALCIVPPLGQRRRWQDADSLLVFLNQGGAPGARATFAVYSGIPEDGGMFNSAFSLPLHDPRMSVQQAVDTLMPGAHQLDDAEVELYETCVACTPRAVVGYVAKVLLYLRLDNAVLRELRPYSEVPRTFPGLGRRKREQKLAEVEQLYDRYIVGPDSLPEMAAPWRPGDASKGMRDVSAHWRRGHFKAQPYGPQSSLRKVVFIAPTVVRADKLAVQP